MPTQSNLRAAFWMMCALACMLLMTLSGREITREIQVLQVMELRSALGLLMLYPLVHRAGGLRAMATGRPFMHVVRNIAHYGGQAAWLGALTMIPLAQLVAIEFTAPIWTALLAIAFLGERMNVWKTSAVVLGLLGVLIIVRPSLDSYSAGQFLVLGASVMFAIGYIATKSLTRTDSVVTIIFWMLVIQSVIGIVPAVMIWKMPSLQMLPWIVAIAFSGSYAHYCMARAFVHADATVVMPMDFLRVPATALLGYLAFAETVDVLTIAGAALILFGNTLNLFGRPPTTEPERSPRHNPDVVGSQ